MNFYKLDIEEQRAIIASALHNANKAQAEALQANYERAIATKHELVKLINDITGTHYTAENKLIFTQSPNGTISVTTS